jgi:peptidoglycan L-alanyl-D-glutamate endopeptidase CwlK
MYVFGPKSSANLLSCADRLQRVCRRALSFQVMDFSVICGHRSLEDQQKAFAEGNSTLDGVTKKSKHQAYPSIAVDILPYPGEVNGVNVWRDKQRLAVLAGLMFAAAAMEDVALRWGGDWDGDGNDADQKLKDWVHFELV